MRPDHGRCHSRKHRPDAAGSPCHGGNAVGPVRGAPIKYKFARIDTSANTVTIQRAGADTIEGATTQLIAVGSKPEFVSDGLSAWRISAERFFTVTGTTPNLSIKMFAGGTSGSAILGDISNGGALMTAQELDFWTPTFGATVLGNTYAIYQFDHTGSQLVQIMDTGTVTAGVATTGVLCVNKVASNSRSINALGTVNASGADYAEYETKSEGCPIIAAGDLCGFDANGLLTTSWAASKRVAIKSTDPNLVGGDNWASHLTSPVHPRRGDDPVRGADESEDAFEARVAAWVSAYEAACTAWEADFATYNTDMETARAAVDRIAYVGKVPCNIAATADDVGKWLVPKEGIADAIAVDLVAQADLTLAQFINAVGWIKSIGEDSRPIVAVGTK